MAEWLAIGDGGPEGFPHGLIARLRTESEIYHLDATHSSYQWLKSSGIECQLVPEGVLPESGLILVPINLSLREKRDVGSSMRQLVQVVDRLYGPGGCPWDQEQTHESLKKYLLEESYELFDAIDSALDQRIIEELGDVILQPVMHAQKAAMTDRFDTKSILDAIIDKLIRRHPHVFGDTEAHTPDEVLKNWDSIKKSESNGQKSILSGVPKSLPSLLRAFEVSKRAARAGFEWPDLQGVVDKLDEEIAELKQALESNQQSEIESELGDILFTCVNVARWTGVEPEESLRKMLERFCERFSHMEQLAGDNLSSLSPEQWDELWNAAKDQITIAGGSS